jgi:primosomal protein N' (replication factor Y)
MILFYEVSIIGRTLKNLTYSSSKAIELLSVVKVSIKSKEFEAVIIKSVDRPTFKTIDIIEVTDLYIRERDFKLVQFISKYYVCHLGEALKLLYPIERTHKPNIDKKSIESKNELSKIQKNALNFIKGHKSSLIFGDTGSGKTEIYIELIKESLNRGNSAIFLMPEISLTPQIERRLKDVFNDSVEIWHSKVTKIRKERILENIKSGKTRIIAGARSALFLPIDNLDLIIVDEEHDDSYKSNNSPRYNAKDLSLYISKEFGVRTLLGSATPSLNSYYKIPYIRLRGGHFKAQKRFMFDSIGVGLTEKVKDIIKKYLLLEKQIIIFVPTRANFKYQKCQNCQESVKCPFCSVNLSLHSDKNALVCHYCDYHSPTLSNCPSCGSEELMSFRVGTSEILSLLKEEFNQYSIEKFDRDSIKSEKILKDTLNRFNEHKIDILVGTQMLSKGHDYHNVSLAIILGVDSLMSMQDYKARERAMSLVVQISGRSGRKEQGDIVIQSKHHQLISNYILDYEKFLKDELQFREGLYPPFVKIAKLVFVHKEQKKAYELMQNSLKKLELIIKDEVQIVGYGEETIFKVASKYRYHILLRSANISKLLGVLHSIRDSNTQIDMDPVVI